MNTLSKLFWAFLAGLVLLWIGGGTPLEATNDKPAVCHPVEGRGETGTGWNIIPPDKASSHIDEETGAGKHTRKDGRTDVYAVNGMCPASDIPVVPEVIPPTCDAPGSTVPNEGITWVDGDDGIWVAYFNDGFFFEQGVNNIFDLNQLTEADGCIPATTVPPTTVPPTTEPPVTTVPPVEDCTTGAINEFGECEPVGSGGDFPVDTTVPDVATGLPPVPPATELPATGTATKFIAVIAAILLLCGFALALAARRPENNIKLPWRND